MSMRDEDDLTNEELLSMWAEGESVTVVFSTRLELENVPWAHEFVSASRGLLPEKGLTMYPGAAFVPHGPSIQTSTVEEALPQSA